MNRIVQEIRFVWDRRDAILAEARRAILQLPGAIRAADRRTWISALALTGVIAAIIAILLA